MFQRRNPKYLPPRREQPPWAVSGSTKKTIRSASTSPGLSWACTTTTAVALEMMALTSNNRADWGKNNPNSFAVYLFNATAWVEDAVRPPPLSHALDYSSFDTADWRNSTMERVVLFRNISASSSAFTTRFSLYVIKLIKTTEPNWNLYVVHPNYIVARAFVLTNPGGRVAFFSSSQQRLFDGSSNKQRRRIEFLGDSLTAGYCNLCLKENDFRSEDFTKSWAYLVAEWLDAEYHTEVWSGTAWLAITTRLWTTTLRCLSFSTELWRPLTLIRFISLGAFHLGFRMSSSFSLVRTIT